MLRIIVIIALTLFISVPVHAQGPSLLGVSSGVDAPPSPASESWVQKLRGVWNGFSPGMKVFVGAAGVMLVACLAGVALPAGLTLGAAGTAVTGTAVASAATMAGALVHELFSGP